MRWCSICPTLDAEQPPVLTRLAVFADPWPGPVAVWSSSDGLSFSQARVGARAVDRRRDARRSAGRSDGALAPRELSRAALRRRARLGVRHRIVWRRQCGRGAARRRRLGGYSVRQCRTGRRPHLSHCRGCCAARPAANGRLVRICRPAHRSCCIDEHVVPIASGLDALERSLQLRVVMAGRDHGDPTALALSATPQATALQATDAGASEGYAWRERRYLQLDPPHARRWRQLGGRSAARRG